MKTLDRILYNGNIITLDVYKPRVNALAIFGDTIIAYGSDTEVSTLGGVNTIRENLDGRTIIPGLIDAHVHWQKTTQVLQQIDLTQTRDKADVLKLIAEYATTCEPGEWIIGFGWLNEHWEDTQFPAAQNLDAVVANHPVYLTDYSHHAAWVNSKALQIANITAESDDPPGGRIQRDADGTPIGILLELSAMKLVSEHIPKMSAEELAQAMKTTQQQALACGLTGFHDFDDAECFQALQILQERDELAMRAVKNFNRRYLESMLDAGFRWGFGNEWLRLGGLKIFADGALGPRTASMIEPYEDDPDNYGVIVTDKEETIDLVNRASAAGFPSTIHAIGDRAVRDVLDAYEIVRQQEKERGISRSTRRHRIEHIQLIQREDIKRMARQDIIASMQPLHATNDYEIAERYWGNERIRLAYNPRLQLDQAVVVAFGSDAPVESFKPFWGIHAAVTRRRADGAPGEHGWVPEARVTIDEALRGFTLGPAYAAGLERRLGRLAPGYSADLVVIDRDPYSIPTEELRNIQVNATMVGGEWQYGEM